MKRGRPIVALVSKQRVVGANNGSSAYLIAIARSLRDAGFDVELIQPSPAIAGRTPYIRLRPEMSVFARHAIRGARRIGSLFIFTDLSIMRDAALGMLARAGRMAGLKGGWTKDRPRSYAVATEWSEDDLAFCQENIDPSAKLILADYMFCAPAFAFAPQGAGKAIVMHDLFHARGGGDKDSVALISRKSEITELGKADMVLAIQAAEQAFVEQHVPDTGALLVPMPAEPVESPQPGRGAELLFIGSNTAPNIEGLADFLANAWPLILEQNPSVRLKVAGSMDRAFVGQKFPQVDFLGMVDDLDALYREAVVVISPLTFGSGLKIKLIEGMAQGKAMVVSSITLQGVEDVCGPGVICADQAEDVAQSILKLVEDDQARRELGLKALEIARASFSAEAVHADLRAWARSIV